MTRRTEIVAETCPACGGAGYTWSRSASRTMQGRAQMPCPTCEGNGSFWPGWATEAVANETGSRWDSILDALHAALEGGE